VTVSQVTTNLASFLPLHGGGEFLSEGLYERNAMPKQTLTLDSMGDIDAGALRVAVNQALKLVTNDLSDRPALNKKRTVTIELEFKPELDRNSGSPVMEGADVSWQVKQKVPAIRRDGVAMKPQQDGQLYFHSDLPQDPDDETIMDEAERRKLERERRKANE
jgi:hypothetical protein